MEEGDVAADALEEGALLGDFSGEEDMGDEPLTGSGGLRVETAPAPKVVRRTSSSGGSA